MANWIKYGKYYISAGIAVAGVLWFNRPGDKRIMGEDVADLFEDAMEKKVVPYLTGEEQPDWYGANNSYSNILDSRILYSDILTIGSRARDLWTKNGSIYWTTNMFTSDTYEPAKLLGSYSITNTGGGYAHNISTSDAPLTNSVYSYGTNTYSDALVTTATRFPATLDKIHPVIIKEPGNGAVAIDPTNMPIANLVFGHPATSIEDIAPYKSWPFEWSFSYPWEQWSYVNHSRITIKQSTGYNLSWTNLVWLSTNDLEFSFTPEVNNVNEAGYSFASFANGSNEKSVPFVYIAKPPAGNSIYMDFAGAPSGYITSYVNNLTKSYPWDAFNVSIMLKDYYWTEGVDFTVIGDYVYMFEMARIDAGTDTTRIDYLIICWDSDLERPRTPSNMLSVIKFWLPARTNVSPIYCALSISDPAPVKTNAYFTVDSDLATALIPSGNATLESVTTSFTANDDKRIMTNKLDGLAQILTGMHRTVYFGGIDCMFATNKTYSITESGTNAVTQYFYENTYGTGDTVTYPNWGATDQYISDFISASQISTNSGPGTSLREIYEEELLYYAFRFGDVSKPDGGTYTWYSQANIFGQNYEKRVYQYKGINPPYPSTFAITNGYVKKVTVYAVYSVRMGWAPNYLSYCQYDADVFSGPTVSHSVNGNYWTTYNTGLAVVDKTLSIPTEAIPDARVKYMDISYEDSMKNNKTYCKIFEVDNPTEKIYFDLNPATVTPMDFTSRHGYSYRVNDKTPDEYGDVNWREHETWNYSGGASINLENFMIVVDWNFQHLGNGFTPSNNVPGWRQ